MASRQTITVSQSTFDHLNANRPEGVTWDAFLSELTSDTGDDTQVHLAPDAHQQLVDDITSTVERRFEHAIETSNDRW